MRRPRLYQHVVLIAFAAYALAPVYLVLLASMREEAELFAGPLALPWPLDLSNFLTIWQDRGFSGYFLNSLIMSAGATIIVTIVAPLAGYAFSKYRFRGREVIFGFFLVGLVLPAPAVIVALYGNLHAMGLLDSYWGVILPQAAILLPFAVFMMRTVTEDVPNELLEAGAIDGVTQWQAFTRIVLPLIMPGVRSLALIVFLFAWQEYLLPLVVIQSESLKPLTVGAATLQGRYGVNYSGIAAAGVLAFLPIVALFLVMQRSFVRGLAVGALK